MSEKILVVDDEMSVFRVVKRFLDRWGYSSNFGFPDKDC